MRPLSVLQVRDLVQGVSLVAFPFYAQLPSGVFMYWIPNSLWSLAQGALVRQTAASRGLRGLTPAARQHGQNGRLGRATAGHHGLL